MTDFDFATGMHSNPSIKVAVGGGGGAGLAPV